MPTATLKIPPLLRRAALLLPLFCLSLLARAQSNYFSSGTVSFQTSGPDNRQVQFKVRETYSELGRARPLVGQRVPTGATLDFGDGTAPETVTVTVLSTGNVGPTNTSYYVGEFTTTHTYATPGRYLALVRGGSRINSGSFALATFVAAGAANDSPVSTPVPLVLLPAGRSAATYQVPARDPNGDALTYSLATPAETGDASGFINPAALSINSRTGELSVNTMSNPGRFYTAVVKVSDGTTSIYVDQLIELVSSVFSNTAPVFAAPTPPDGQRISIYAGSDGKQNFRFLVRATDADAGDVVTLRATGLPPGATLTPGLPTSGNPVETTFSLTLPGNTPDAIVPITFTAEDSHGAQTTIALRLELHGGAYPVFVTPTPPNGQVFAVAPGQPVQFTVKVQDISNIFGVLTFLRPFTPLPPGATLTYGINTANVIEATFSWTPTAADVGIYTVGFEAVDREDAHAATVVTIRVTLPCNAAATQPVAGPDQLSTAAGPLTITPAELLANDTDPQGRALKLSRVGALTQGRGTLVTNADGTFTFTPAPGFVGTASFNYELDLSTSVLASRATGHYYQFVDAPGISWTQARQQASSATYQGLRGYLATITSAAEKEFLAGRSSGNYWFGASDAAVEGEWRWTTGPEAGQLFWRGAANGTALAYHNWAPGEPNDYKNRFRPAGEDYAQLYGASGFWNDLSDRAEGASVAGYVVEYGGLEACTPELFATGTVTIQVGPAAPAIAQRGASAARASANAVLEAAPNPSSGQFRLRVTAAADGPAQLDLYDVQGRHVKAIFAGSLRGGEVRELPVEASELATGVYLVRLQSGSRVQHLRVVVQK